MTSILGGSVSSESFLMTLICVVLIAYFCYKEWPEFKKRVSGSAKTEYEDKTLEGRLGRLEKRLDDMSDMLSRDYIRLNIIEKMSRANSKAISDSLEERRIIMEALLGCLHGLKEVGANDTTGKAIADINEYLNRQAHVNQEVIEDFDAPKLNPNI